MTKECYICRQEIELIAKVKKPAKQGSGTGSQLFDDNQLSACLVAPDTLHHLTSRQNTLEDLSAASGGRRGTLEDHSLDAPSLELAPSRRNTLHALDPIMRPETIDEEPIMSQPTSVDVV